MGLWGLAVTMMDSHTDKSILQMVLFCLTVVCLIVIENTLIAAFILHHHFGDNDFFPLFFWHWWDSKMSRKWEKTPVIELARRVPLLTATARIFRLHPFCVYPVIHIRSTLL